MKRSEDLKKARIAYVKKVVNTTGARSHSKTKAVRKLSKKLFLSPATIWNDLKSE